MPIIIERNQHSDDPSLEKEIMILDKKDKIVRDTLDEDLKECFDEGLKGFPDESLLMVQMIRELRKFNPAPPIHKIVKAVCPHCHLSWETAEPKNSIKILDCINCGKSFSLKDSNG